MLRSLGRQGNTALEAEGFIESVPRYAESGAQMAKISAREVREPLGTIALKQG